MGVSLDVGIAALGRGGEGWKVEGVGRAGRGEGLGRVWTGEL